MNVLSYTGFKQLHLYTGLHSLEWNSLYFCTWHCFYSLENCKWYSSFNILILKAMSHRACFTGNLEANIFTACKRNTSGEQHTFSIWSYCPQDTYVELGHVNFIFFFSWKWVACKLPCVTWTVPTQSVLIFFLRKKQNW